MRSGAGLSPPLQGEGWVGMGFLSVTAKPIPTPAFPSKGKETSGWPRAANSSQTCCSPRQHPLDQVRQLRRRPRPDRKNTRLNPVTNAHLVCRLLLEKKKIVDQI